MKHGLKLRYDIIVHSTLFQRSGNVSITVMHRRSAAEVPQRVNCYFRLQILETLKTEKIKIKALLSDEWYNSMAISLYRGEPPVGGEYNRSSNPTGCSRTGSDTKDVRN